MLFQPGPVEVLTCMGAARRGMRDSSQRVSPAGLDRDAYDLRVYVGLGACYFMHTYYARASAVRIGVHMTKYVNKGMNKGMLINRSRHGQIRD